jgi:hypothetical protein
LRFFWRLLWLKKRKKNGLTPINEVVAKLRIFSADNASVAPVEENVPEAGSR